MEWITYCTDIKKLENLKDAGITMVLAAEKTVATRVPVRFRWNEIVEIKKECQRLGLKLGLMMNRIFFDEDIVEVHQTLLKYKEIVDRIDYTDPAVYIEAKKLKMEHKLCYNPDTLMCNYRDVQFYQDLGIDSVVISKEITLDEMKEISRKTSGKTEVIIFGYLNMSYSKRKLLSCYMDEIQKEEDIFDRRDLYLIETTRNGKMPVVEDEYGTSIYTDYVLAGLKEIKELMESGVDQFRFDCSFLKEEMFMECLAGFKAIVNGKDADEVFNELKDKYPLLSTGYMYQKTNLVK